MTALCREYITEGANPQRGVLDPWRHAERLGAETGWFSDGGERSVALPLGAGGHHEPNRYQHWNSPTASEDAVGMGRSSSLRQAVRTAGSGVCAGGAYPPGGVGKKTPQGTHAVPPSGPKWL